MGAGEPDAAERMRERLQVDLRAAIKGRRAHEVSDLRHLIAALDNAGAVPLTSGSQSGPSEVQRRRLDGTAVEAVLQREYGAARRAADEFARLGRNSEAERAEHSVAVTGRYLRSPDSGAD